MKGRERFTPYLDVFRLTWPIALGMANNALMQFVDRVFLSQESTASLEAVLPASVLAGVFVCFFQSVVAYSGTFVAQYFGAGSVSGGGMNEQVAAKLMDPDGKAVWEKGDAIHAYFVALPRPRKTGAWSLSLSRSRTGQWDDASASVIGVPGFLFPVEGRRWTFAGRNWRKAANK